VWFDTAAISFFIVSIPIKYVAAWIWVHPRWIHGVTPTAFSAAAAARDAALAHSAHEITCVWTPALT
jgi:hypothetical protein